MRIATWNVNGIRPRLEQIQRFLTEQDIDILCMQEIKIANDIFPHDVFRDMGYTETHAHGQKAHHGVAIFSRVEIASVSNHVFADLDDKRHLSVTLPDGLEIHNFYCPAGGDKPDVEKNPKFDHKLRFYKDMTAYFAELRKADQPMLLMGDLNIAPFEFDVWNHKKLLKSVGHSPTETEHMQALHASADWVDVARHFVPNDQPLYSWWGYRFAPAFERDMGWRLDHMLATKPALERITKFTTVRETRGWEKPSDHAPLIVDVT